MSTERWTTTAVAVLALFAAPLAGQQPTTPTPDQTPPAGQGMMQMCPSMMGMMGGHGMMGGGYHMMGRGCATMNGDYAMMNYQGDGNDTAYQTFQKDTADIRASLAADIAELNTVMAGTNPDAGRARSLSESISAKQNQLAEAARKNNIQAGGNGWYCNRW